MRCIKISFLSIFVSSVIVADSSVHSEYMQNIKKEHGVIFDKLFLQGREKLETKGDIVIWLYRKNKEEFNDIQNLMTDLKVEIGFNCDDEHMIKKELEEHLKEKIKDEARKIFDMDEVTAENVEDFFHMSRMICNAALETDDTCRKMIRAFEKEYRSTVRELKIVDKAREKIKVIDKRRKKQELLHQLREQIIFGTCPRT